MAAPPGPRKRSGAAPPGARNGLPPHKRPKSAPGGAADPFGDCDDFTADDLEEIDILASQALSQDPPAGPAWGAPGRPRAGGEAGSRAGDGLMRDAFQLEVLQTQHEEVKQKLKEMQDEILTKNGEIKILRDSMQQMEFAVEEQKRSYLLLEQQKSQTLSEKEKEFSKKLQSLQSELQFKDAEMNELRARLQNCERNKHVAQTVPAASPKKNFAVQVRPEGCSPQPGRRSFPTKESFSAEMSNRPSCSSGNLVAPTTSIKEDSKMTHPEVSSLVHPEAAGKNGSHISVPKPNTQGCILLNALLKQPIVPGSSLGLCHLLCSSSEPLPGAVVPPSSLETMSTQLPSSRMAPEEIAPLVSLQEAQKLAVTGLNLIAMDEGLCEGSQGGFLAVPRHRIPGAVHLLPLVEHHVGAYCRAGQVLDTSGNGSCGNHSAVSSRTSTATGSSKEDFRLSLEETAVISLGILYYLVFYSWDVVHTLLSGGVEKGAAAAAGGEQVSEVDKNVLCDNQCGNKEDTRTQGPAPQDAPSNDRAQHSLLKKLLQVLAFSAARGSQADRILSQSLKVLVKLAENSTMDLLINFQQLLSSQTLLHCLCAETPLPAALLTVRLLCVLAQHHVLAAQLCSHSDTCLLLALYMYLTSRPDKSASEILWLQLEQELTLMQSVFVTDSQAPGTLHELLQTSTFITWHRLSVQPRAAVKQKCPVLQRMPLPYFGLLENILKFESLKRLIRKDHNEVVKALIIMLHRQWMKIRRAENSLCAHKEQIIQFLRDAVLLLHSLSQKDKLFHEHCLEVLHQYDQAMPGVRAILKKTQKLSACEELILDELYPLEPEDQGVDSS